MLRAEFARSRHVLEIGSGTGQHAVYFGKNLPHLIWQTSDVPGNHAGIQAWLHAFPLENVLQPLSLDVNERWPGQEFDAVFSANTTHIMSWPLIEKMFSGIESVLSANGVFCLYGPFNYRGNYTSASNQRFDGWLKARDPQSGVRDFEAINELALKSGMSLHNDYEMQANNRTLVWIRNAALTHSSSS